MTRRIAVDPLPGFHVVRPYPREEITDDLTLKCLPIVHRGSGVRPEVALTFDDGPSRWTAAIAATFDQHDCRATFFVRGSAIEEADGVIAGLVATGHEVGNHLWSHPDASKLTAGEIRAELRRTGDAIEAAGAPWPRLLRPPYFRGPRNVAAAGRNTKARKVVLRSIGSSDWEADCPDRISEPVLAHARAGDVVCLHDGVPSPRHAHESRRPTVEAVKRLVPGLLENGLRPVTVTRLLSQTGGA